MKRIVILLMGWVAVLSLAGCGGGSGGGSTTSPVSTTYSTTTNKGDYAQWTLTGTALTATWSVENATGGIDYTYNIVASCSAEAANGTRTCTVDPVASSCTDGLSTCTGSPTGSFDLMEAPGVALFIHTVSATGSDQLHIGFVKNSNACSDDVSGDYTFIRTGLGLDEAFGMYRSDTNFLNILHSNFGFDTSAKTITPTVMYRTSSESELLGDGGCVSGVRTRTSGPDTLRSMMTKSGLFVLDMPAGQGGLLSFKTTNAASLADFASKSFKGIVFPDNGPPELVTATSSAMTGSEVPLAAIVPAVPGPTQTLNLKVQALGTPATISLPGYPGFTVAPAGYSASALAVTYATPNTIPGLFKLDGELFDRNGTPGAGRVILAAMNFNSKLIIIGMNYNYRTPFDINPATGIAFIASNLYNTGNFILFEK